MNENINEEKEKNVSIENENNEELNEVEIVEEEAKEEKAPYDGPSVTVNIRYDYRTLKYFNVYSMIYKKHYPIIYLVLALFCLGYDTYYVLSTILPTIQAGTELNPALFLIPGLFLIFAIYSIYLFFNFEKSIDKNLTLHFNNSPVTSVKAKVTLESVEITSSKNPEEPFTYDWIYITQICEIPEFYYLYVGKQPIIISKDPNNFEEGDLETLKQIISEVASIKPYKCLNKNIVKKPITYVHREDIESTEIEAEEIKEESVNEEETASNETSNND